MELAVVAMSFNADRPHGIPSRPRRLRFCRASSCCSSRWHKARASAPLTSLTLRQVTTGGASRHLLRIVARRWRRCYAGLWPHRERGPRDTSFNEDAVRKAGRCQVAPSCTRGCCICEDHNSPLPAYWHARRDPCVAGAACHEGLPQTGPRTQRQTICCRRLAAHR